MLKFCTEMTGHVTNHNNEVVSDSRSHYIYHKGDDVLG